MKLLALFLLVLTAIAAAVPARRTHDSPKAVGGVLPASVLADALGKNMFMFSWSTEEYCGDDGLLRARGKFHCNGFDLDMEFDGSNHEYNWLKIDNKELHMAYDFNKYVTNFWYGSCKWGALSANCGMCHLNMYNGVRPDCKDQEEKKNKRSRTDHCYLQIDGDVPPPPERAQQEAADTVATRELVLPDANDKTLEDDTIILPVAQSADTAVPVPAGTEGNVGYRGFTLSVTERCDTSLQGTPPMASGYWMPSDSDAGGYPVDFGDGHLATSFDLGTGVNLLVGPYDYSNDAVGFHYGGCHWDQDVRGVGDCGFCKSSAWSPSKINCAMNPAAARTHLIECSVAVAWENASSPARPKLAARDDNIDEVDTLHTDDKSMEDLALTRTVAPEVAATQTTADSETTILSFHYTLTEYCFNGKLEAWGHFQNGGFNKDMNLYRGLINAVDHLVRPYPPVQIGDYKYDSHHLRFAYQNGPINCEWFDNEKDKKCGECRAADWTGPELDCSLGGLHERTKDMGCSFILGTSQTS